MEEYEINKIEKFDIMGLERKLQGTNENNEAKEKENDLWKNKKKCNFQQLIPYY